MAEIRMLCAKANPAPLEMSVPIYVEGKSWDSVPVRSIQKASGEGRVAWAVTGHYAQTTEAFVAERAWSDSAAPIQKTVATSGSLISVAQFSADCRTGRNLMASLFQRQDLKTVEASIYDGGKLMSSMPAHIRFGYESACAAIGLR